MECGIAQVWGGKLREGGTNRERSICNECNIPTTQDPDMRDSGPGETIGRKKAQNL